MTNFFIIGMMGAGKTTISKELTKHYKCFLLDIDEEIEKKRGMSVNEIFKKYSEATFRSDERLELHKIPVNKNIIISCGGGIILNKDNVNLMHSKGKIIYLYRSPKNILKTLDYSTRPLLKDNPEKFLNIYKEREALYQSAADVTIDNNKSIKNTIKLILKYIDTVNNNL